MEVKGNEGLFPSCYKHKSAVKKIDWQALKKNIMILSIEPKADLSVRGSESFKLKFTLRRKDEVATDKINTKNLILYRRSWFRKFLAYRKLQLGTPCYKYHKTVPSSYFLYSSVIDYRLNLFGKG